MLLEINLRYSIRDSFIDVIFVPTENNLSFTIFVDREFYGNIIIPDIYKSLSERINYINHYISNKL